MKFQLHCKEAGSAMTDKENEMVFSAILIPSVLPTPQMKAGVPVIQPPCAIIVRNMAKAIYETGKKYSMDISEIPEA